MVENRDSDERVRELQLFCVWLTCGDGGEAPEERLSEFRLFFLAVAAATVAAELLAQPTMKPMEPTFVADSSAYAQPGQMIVLFERQYQLDGERKKEREKKKQIQQQQNKRRKKKNKTKTFTQGNHVVTLA